MRTGRIGCPGLPGSNFSRVRIRQQFPGIGVRTLTVAAKAIRARPPRSLLLRLSSRSRLGAFTGDLAVSLRRKKSGTVIRLNVLSARSDGALGRLVIPPVADELQPALEQGLSGLSMDRKQSGVKVALRTAKVGGSRARAKVSISARSWTTSKTRATGRVRLLHARSGRQLCSAPIGRNSTARCTFAAPMRGTPLLAVASGSLDNGYRLWHSASGRYLR